MKTKISILTLFACAAAGTALFADNENYDRQTIAAETSFNGKSLVNSSWIKAIIGDSSGYVYFRGTDLTGASFTNATITKADFSFLGSIGITNLSNALFTGATITDDTHFYGATLTNANFENAKIGDVYFYGADLTGANFTGATITKADFSFLDFIGITNLSNALFTGATITDSYFTGATLTGANFTNAEFQNVAFESADLTRADFRGATGATFSSSSILKNTLLADGKIDGFSMTSEADSFPSQNTRRKRVRKASVRSSHALRRFPAVRC